MNVIICGLASTGKSTLAKLVAKHFKMEYISSSTLLKGMLGYDYRKQKDFWDTKGLYLSNERNTKTVDKELDKIQLKLAKEGNKVFDSWAMGWLYKGKAIKILISASEKVRAERMSKRDSLSKAECIRSLKKRDKENGVFFKKLYSIDILNDIRPFDLIINTDELNEKEVYNAVKDYIKNKL